MDFLSLSPSLSLFFFWWGVGIMQDYKQQRPSQELVARDLHGVEWSFRHIYRGKFSAGISSFGHEVKFIICSYQLNHLNAVPA